MPGRPSTRPDLDATLRRMRKTLLTLTLCVLATAAIAQDIRGAVASYQLVAMGDKMLCEGEVDEIVNRQVTENQVARLQQRLPENTGTASGLPCIEATAAKLQERYRALDALLRDPESKAALREHFIATTMAIKTLAPAPGEVVRDLELRRGEANRRVKEAWIRFELTKK